MLKDHQRQRIRQAQEALRHRQIRQEEGDFIKQVAEWGWLAAITFAFAYAPNIEGAFAMLKSWLKRLERAAGGAIAWAAALGTGHLGYRRHFHVLIAGVEHLNMRTWEADAKRTFGDTRIEAYDETRAGAHYLAKNDLAAGGDLRFGGNLLEDCVLSNTATRRKRGRPRRLDIDAQEVIRLRDQEGESWRDIGRRFESGATTVRRLYQSCRTSTPASNESGPYHKSPKPSVRSTQPTKLRSDAAIQISIAGAGSRRDDGSGSGYVWAEPVSGIEVVVDRSGVTKLEAEWSALLAALKNVDPGQTVEIITSCPALGAQFEERMPLSGKRSLSRVVALAFDLISRCHLNVSVIWLPAHRNPAAKRLKRARRAGEKAAKTLRGKR